MKNVEDPTIPVQFVSLVNKYATPFAVILVLMGIGLSHPPAGVRNGCISLIVFSVLFNLIAVRGIEQGRWTNFGFINTRLLVNLVVNIVLVFLLDPYWMPIWLLLTLTPIATAIYEGRRQTMIVAGSVSVILLAIHFLRRFNTPLDWGQQVAYCLFIVLMSLMINELAELARLRRSDR